MRRLIALVALLCCLTILPAHASDGVVILCYHDVGKVTDAYMVTKENLAGQFGYLKQNGYHPISLQQYIDANTKNTPLPDKAVLLTFDDGNISFYNDVFPLLKQYQYPAVLAVVTTWQTSYKPPDVGKLVSWQQMREMEASGLVAIASHTNDLHHGIVANAFGDRGQPAGGLSYYNGKYETLEEYKNKITQDLTAAQTIFEHELGHKVEALVWPYGSFTTFAIDIAKDQGFKAFFALGSGVNPIGEKSLLEARRGIVVDNPDSQLFAKFLKAAGDTAPPMRSVSINLDQIYDATSTKQTEANLKFAIERLQRLGVKTVFIQTYSENSDGNIQSVYFNTTKVPVKAAIFDHVARRFRDAGMFVYAVMPRLMPELLTEQISRKSLVEMYADLAAYSYINGVVFEDGLHLSKDLTSTAQQISAPQIKTEWPETKASMITAFTQELMETIRQYKPQAKFVRAISAEAFMNSDSQKYLSQNYDELLATYDYTLITTYPNTKRHGIRSAQWLAEVANIATKPPGSAAKLVFGIQTYDWENKRWLLDGDVKEYMNVLRARGVLNFSYYPDAMFNEKNAVLTQ